MTSGFRLRSSLKFTDQRRALDYWISRAESRAMPSRSDIDPCAMREFLPHLSIIDVTDGLHRARVRLAGSKLREVYGLELTGLFLRDLEWGEKWPYWQKVYNHIINTGEPSAGTIDGPIRNREHLTLHWLRMPLSDDGKTVNKVLCLDIAVPTISMPSGTEAGEELLAATI